MARPTRKITKVEVEGPLAPFAAAYRSRLRESGYTPLTIVNELRQVADMSSWMLTNRLSASDMTTVRIEEFLTPRL